MNLIILFFNLLGNICFLIAAKCNLTKVNGKRAIVKEAP